MTETDSLPDAARRRLARPLALTRAGLLAERAARAFWPLWTLLLVVLALLMTGAQDHAPLEAVWAVGVVAVLGGVALAGFGLWRFRWPTRAEALDRLDRSLPGRPISAIGDSQAVGAGDAASQAVWQAHLLRMTDRLDAARAQRPDLQLADRDPFALRYVALLAFVMALLFGSVWRVASVGGMAPGGGGAAVAAGPAWEGWIEPPAHTGKPSIYLPDVAAGRLTAPEGSRVTLRLYGDPGALTVDETVSGRTGDIGSAADPQQSFDIAQAGRLEIDGPGGRGWDLALLPDAAPEVEITAEPERAADGEVRVPFRARDDFGVVSGRAIVELDLDAIDRRYGLAVAPEDQEPIIVDLPMPISGSRSEFEEVVIENFSQHPWANLPVVATFEVSDATGQTGRTDPLEGDLPGLRFFQPLAAAVAEQRRDLLWNRANAPRVAQVLRAASYRPEDVFASRAIYLRLRTAIRRLEAGIDEGDLSDEQRDEIAAALWDIANEIEYGELSDALERLRRAQERLSEAMRNGASEEEIAELMEELREATQDYIRQLAEQSEGAEDQQQAQGETQKITGDQLQQMMDRIQELMEQGRMAEAQALLDQLAQMMENMRVTRGEGGEGQQGQGGQAMEGLQDMLRDQQGLSDDTFGDLQEQYGQPSQPFDGQPRRRSGRQPGQPGEGQQGGENGGEDGGPGSEDPGQSLAQRQQELRRELDRQQQSLPGGDSPEGDAARRSLDEAGEAMDRAEEALRDRDYAGALDEQSQAMERLREGMRNLGEALARDQQQQQPGQEGGSDGESSAEGKRRDPLGRTPGGSGSESEGEFQQGGDVYRRAEELLEELRRRSGDQSRPDEELDYLRRLLDRF
ncbi:DUF4175 domain-containing protein [Mesobaculum littorinae]|uniref:DUF4175 domain-containing protein n=1 Tax=Mesobaculum littorinae TaxID=2486419 RepID=A0A438AE87_9RHOB|nr:DUF4175 family protein [Mesobaculum littorinae]RVV96999.1 DUF4175 domain-containing protein [Mesobaculum littorinae]